jgi:hypothetical protein
VKIKIKREENKMGNGRNLKMARSPKSANLRKTPLRVNNHERPLQAICGDNKKTDGKPVRITKGHGGQVTCDTDKGRCHGCPHPKVR